MWMFRSALKMCPAAAEINPKPDALETVSVLTKKPKTSVKKKPPMKPSQVFFGESCRRKETQAAFHIIMTSASSSTTCGPRQTCAQSYFIALEDKRRVSSSKGPSITMDRL